MPALADRREMSTGPATLRAGATTMIQVELWCTSWPGWSPNQTLTMVGKVPSRLTMVCWLM